jgi:hypothetical protein
MNKTRFTLLAAMILAAAASRLIPHPPNFTPIAAIALFGGAQFSSKRIAFLVPLLGLLLSDLVFGFFPITPVVYGSFALMVCMGIWMHRRHSVPRIAFAAVASAILFFILTNFGVWAIDNLYPKTVGGLVDCYIAAIPFFQNTLLGNLLYSTLLFGGFELAEYRFVRLAQPAADAA